MDRRVLVSALALLAFAPLALPGVASVAAQENTLQKPLLTPEDYGQWESLGVTELSPDGRWLAYTISRVEGDGELRIREVEGAETRVIALGDRPVFSADSRWLAYGIGVSDDDEEDEGPARRKAVLRDLRTGEETTYESVSSFSFDPDARALVLNGYAPPAPGGGGRGATAQGGGRGGRGGGGGGDAAPRGSDIRVVDLESGALVPFGSVADFAWSPTGSLLALRLSTGDGGGNGVQLWDPRAGVLRSLDISDATYTGMSWRDEGFDLVVLRSGERADDSQAHQALVWRALDRGVSAPLVLDASTSGMSAGRIIAETRSPQWVGDDGSMIAVGLRPVEEASEDPGAVRGSGAGEGAARRGGGEDEPEPADVQIWHTSDVLIYPQQESRLAADRRRTLLAVWHLDDDRLVPIGSDLDMDVDLTEDGRWGIEEDEGPYAWGRMFGRPYRDLYRIDARTGERAPIQERVRYSYLSAAGRYLLTFDGEDYWSVELATGEPRNLTADLPGTFAEVDYDTPTDVLPPHGVTGWLEGDEAVLLNDEFDIWRVAPDGSGGERLTRGAEEEVVHRRVSVGARGNAIDPDEPILLSLRGKWTKEEGYARLNPDGSVDRLILEDRMVRSLEKADSADLYLFRMQAADDSPDLFAAGPDLREPRQLTETNPFQDDYAWPRSELIDFESEAGIRLQGALRYPANYEPGRRYPMIVYTYEIVSTGLHNYTVPTERSYYNDMVWQQAGYFVLRPDIVFRARDPGVATLEALRPAVAAVVEMGLVDPERVGLIGHSWGGYEAAYVPTRSNLFAAAVSGAALTDFVSMMGAIHWSSGLPEVQHWETGQARMEVPFWDDPEAHRRNSPVHGVHQLETPILMAFGDEDGTVDFDQGTEFFNFARRAGKQVVLLVYEGEDHGFRQRKNQVDYQRRILEWFGHYLKGEPAPRWITDGIPVAEQDAERERIARKGSGGGG